jgi:hypothetical protein
MTGLEVRGGFLDQRADFLARELDPEGFADDTADLRPVMGGGEFII